MQNLWTYLVVVLRAALGSVLLGTLAQAQRAPRSVTAGFSAPTRDIFAAIAHGDTVALRALVGDDLHWVLATSGAVINKSQLVAAAGRTSPLVSLAYSMDSMRTWRHADVATADYRLTDRRTFREYTNTFIARASDLFVRRRGRWELVRHTRTWIIHPPTMMALDSASLSQFVGRYQRGTGYVDDVHFSNGYLVAQSTLEALVGSPGAHLLPVSDNTFSPEGAAPMIVFERNARGEVIGYVQQSPDGTIARARRLESR